MYNEIWKEGKCTQLASNLFDIPGKWRASVAYPIPSRNWAKSSWCSRPSLLALQTKVNVNSWAFAEEAC